MYPLFIVFHDLGPGGMSSRRRCGRTLPLSQPEILLNFRIGFGVSNCENAVHRTDDSEQREISVEISLAMGEERILTRVHGYCIALTGITIRCLVKLILELARRELT